MNLEEIKREAILNNNSSVKFYGDGSSLKSDIAREYFWANEISIDQSSSIAINLEELTYEDIKTMSLTPAIYCDEAGNTSMTTVLRKAVISRNKRIEKKTLKGVLSRIFNKEGVK